MNAFDTFSPDGQPIFVTSIPNKRGTAGPVRWAYARSAEDIAQFVEKHSAPGMAVYFAVARLQDGAETRATETVKETMFLWGEVDFKHHPTVARDEIYRRLTQSPKPPSIVVFSGHGYHVYWRLLEPEDLSTDAGRLRVREALSLACQHIGGDPGVCEVARLMRVPGSTNTKDGDSVPVETLIDSEREYDLNELQDWWLEARPLLPAPTMPAAASNGHAAEDGPFAAHGAQFKPPTDVAARLEAMTFEGAGAAGIHATQRDVSASELRNGCTVEFVVQELLAATKRAVEGDDRCTNWDWTAEEHGIQELCFGFINKLHPELYTLLPDALRERWEQALTDGRRPKVFHSRHIGWHVRTFKEQDEADSAGKPETAKPAAATQKARVILRPFSPIDPAALPPRQWLYGKHYRRGIVSATIAPGGTGKTSLVMVEAVALATARDLLGEQPKERCRVWLHNGEDNTEELDRRTIAICQHYGIPQEELTGWLFTTSGSEMPLKVANGYSELKIDNALVDEMTRRILDQEVDVVMFDPLVTLHSVSEQDNGKVDAVVRVFTRIADICSCAIDISHHTRKLPAGASDTGHIADDSRGASAFHDAVRSMRILNVMSATDAEKLGLGEFDRLSYFRVDRGKANTVKPASAATWRKFESVVLANGDDVGVVTAWEMPGHGTPEMAAAEQQAEQVFLKLLDKFMARGGNVSANPGPTYAPARFAGEREAKEAKVSKAALKGAMGRLLDTGRIRSEAVGRSDRPSHRLVPWQGAPE